MSRSSLPVNIDTTYADSGSDATVKTHQQHHDAIHAVTNLIDSTSGAALLVTNTQTASYTLVLSDAGKMVEMNVGTANNFTVPPNSSVAFAVGETVYGRQYGAGLTTIVQGAGVTILSRGSVTNSAGRYAEWQLTKRATDEWILTGDVA